MLKLRIQRAVILLCNIGDLPQQFLRKADSCLNTVGSQMITLLLQFDNILSKKSLTIYKLYIIV